MNSAVKFSAHDMTRQPCSLPMGVGSGGQGRAAAPLDFIHDTGKVVDGLMVLYFRSCFFFCLPPPLPSENFLPTPLSLPGWLLFINFTNI